MFTRQALKLVRLQPLTPFSKAQCLSFARGYAKGGDDVDLVHIPLKSMGVLTDFYVPPKLSNCPVKSWPKVILRSIGSFGLSTYFVGKFKLDTRLKLRLFEWKELAMEKYVKTNKIFAAACSQATNQRRAYIQTQLDGIVSTEVKNNLAGRASSFPHGARLEWNLKKIEKAPLVKLFQIIPDKDEVVAFLQLVIKLETRQEMIVHGENIETKKTERLVTDYVVMTLNPFTDEMVFSGTLFAASPYQSLRPTLDGTDIAALFKFQRICADIYRSAPPQQK